MITAMSQPKPAAPMDTDRNLLFGVLALQSAFIDNNQFAEVCAAWTTRKRSPLAELLRERGWISGAEQQQIERSVERHLQRHGGDVRKSLGALADAGVRDLIRAAGDPELRKSLSSLPPAAGYVLVHTLDQTLNAPTRERSRYSITRLHAEGGLGRVYVARDNDLGRDVALKEIKPEQAQHPEAWRRFLKEAQVTGQLEHPNIVPVYELGRRQEDQQPFYCMRLVRGQTLRAAIAAYHERAQTGKSDALELRRLLGAFVNVCQAVGYAHARGVVHRDLKPDNVVLGGFGEVVLLDWGLARLVDEAAAAGSLPAMQIDTQVPGDATQAGVPMGTPAYMAPEQAEGRLDLIDARTDIYGLGAMLFEILTGHPPHEGPGTAQVLQGIVSGDTPRARAAGLRVPAALDAVCARAMAKARARRYARAPDLAEDVQRYLADEPVSVYAEPWPVRAGRWMRKHQALVGSATAGLVLALVFVATLALLIQRQKGALARQNLVLAEANAREGAAAELAQKTIEDMTSQAALEFLETQKELRPEQRQFLERALEYYQQYAATLAVGESTRARPAKAYYSMGYLQARLGLHEAARDSFAASIAEYERLAAEHPQVPQYHQGLANSHNNLGNLLVGVGKRDEAERQYRAALTEQDRLAAEHPQVPQYRRELARSHSNLGNVLNGLGKRDEAEREYRAALTEQERLAAEHPQVPQYRHELARSHNSLGAVVMGVGKRDEAEREYRAALTEQERLTAELPQVPQYRQDLARSHNSLGILLAGLGKRDEAERAYRAALKEQERLATEHPLQSEYRRDLANSRNNLGALLAGLGRRDEAERAYRAALKEQERLAAELPLMLEYRRDLAHSHNGLGNLLAGLGKRDEAERQYRAALKEQERLAAEHPRVPQYRHELARSHNNLGILLKDLGKRDEAEREYHAALTEQKQLAAEHPSVPDFENELAATLGNMAILRNAVSDWDAARELLEQARPHHEAALKANARHVTYRQFYRNNLLAISTSLLGLGDHAAAADTARKLAELAFEPIVDRYNAACIFSRCVRLAEKDTKLPEARRKELVKSYADQAMGLLRQAVAKGYKDAAHMKKDTDLDPIRNREDFKKLIAELEAAAKKQ